MGQLAYLPMCLVNPLSHIAPYFIILLCTPDDFIRSINSNDFID
jgi:hypothetical protein